jgi:hypothetical protein
MEAVEKPSWDLAKQKEDIWYGKTERKSAILLMMTLVYFSTCYLFCGILHPNAPFPIWCKRLYDQRIKISLLIVCKLHLFLPGISIHSSVKAAL